MNPANPVKDSEVVEALRNRILELELAFSKLPPTDPVIRRMAAASDHDNTVLRRRIADLEAEVERLERTLADEGREAMNLFLMSQNSDHME